MKNKILISLLALALLASLFMFTGCYKTTGGGEFYDWYTSDYVYNPMSPPTPDELFSGNHVTFGFTAQPVDEKYEEYTDPIEIKPPGRILANGERLRPIPEEPLLFYLQAARGNLTLVDHTTNAKLKGNFTSTLDVSPLGEIRLRPLMAFFNGTCMVEGEGPYTFVAWFYDTGEYGLQDTFSFVSIVYGNFSESDFEYIYNVIISTLFGPRIDGDHNIPFEYSEFSEDIAGQYFGMLEEGSDIVIHEPELERYPIYR